jgi:dihydroflavonol-4-reductase
VRSISLVSNKEHLCLKVLVTGGTGFVGSQIVAALVRRGDRVRVLRRANSSLIALEGLETEHAIGDILEPESVTRAVAGCDLVFHVAALSSYWRAQRAQVYRVNVEGTRVVMDACVAAGVPRVVHTSSAAAVGIPRDGRPADERMPFDALSRSFAYADSKHQAEGEVYRAIERGLPAVIVNPVAIIGPGDHYLISSSMVVEFARRPIPAVPSGGLCVADIDAVVQGHLTAAERGRVGERYILGGENLTHLQTAAIICAIAGRPAPRLTIPAWLLGPVAAAVAAFNRINPRPPVVSGEQLRLAAYNVFYDSSKAVAELGYPLLPFRPAAERAYHWYLRHGYMP